MNPETSQDPDVLWDRLPRELKVHVLSLLEPAQLARAAAVDHATRDAADAAWRTYYLTGLGEQIKLMREFTNADYQNVDTARAREVFNDLQTIIARIAQDTGVRPDSWKNWQGDEYYGEFYDLFASMDDIYEWYSAHFG